MTEDEAKTKRCPVGAGEMARCDDSFVNLHHYAAKCIGSDCMMWREIMGDDPNDNSPLGSKIVVGGYCGLAGKP